MSNWVRRNSRNGIEYGGSASHYYWDSVNPYTQFYQYYAGQYCNTYNLALPNCTCYAYGRILEAGDPAPHSSNNVYNANNWHAALANGWTYIPFDFDQLKLGDIVEWSSSGRNHVAVVEEIDRVNRLYYISQSFYTDNNGGTSGDRTDTVWGSTKQSVSNYGIANYPNRFFIFSGWAYPYSGAAPDYILKNPNSHVVANNNFRFFRKKYRNKRSVTYYV